MSQDVDIVSVLEGLVLPTNEQPAPIPDNTIDIGKIYVVESNVNVPNSQPIESGQTFNILEFFHSLATDPQNGKLSYVLFRAVNVNVSNTVVIWAGWNNNRIPVRRSFSYDDGFRSVDVDFFNTSNTSVFSSAGYTGYR